MSKVTITVSLLVGCIVAALAIYVSRNDLMRASFLEPGGMIASGSRFGIAVGDRKETIAAKLKRLGLRINNKSLDRKCVSRTVTGDYALYSYDESWRRGVICIGIKGDEVSSIAWSFSAFAP